MAEVQAHAQAEALKGEGNALLAAKDYAGAEAKYSAALLVAPRSSTVLTSVLFSNRALVRFLQQKYEASLADAQECVLLRPDWLKGHFHRVRALLGLGDERAAEAQRCFWEGQEKADGKASPE